MDTSTIQVISLIALLLISALGGWLATRRLKRKLEKGLGHEVKDEEVTSIAAWMKAADRVVDSVINDHSAQHEVENTMEGAFQSWVDRRDAN
jgi:hypothetical protein